MSETPQAIVDHMATMTKSELEARLAHINPIIQILARAWDRPELSAAMVLEWKIDDFSYQSNVIDAVETCCQDVLRQFIHNFCTHLCAEKQIIQGLLLQQNPA